MSTHMECVVGFGGFRRTVDMTYICCCKTTPQSPYGDSRGAVRRRRGQASPYGRGGAVRRRRGYKEEVI